MAAVTVDGPELDAMCVLQEIVARMAEKSGIAGDMRTSVSLAITIMADLFVNDPEYMYALVVGSGLADRKSKNAETILSRLRQENR